jgi:cleavage and polyadenylation specificity factor subunit 3
MRGKDRTHISILVLSPFSLTNWKCKVVGRLAQKPPPTPSAALAKSTAGKDQIISGVLVQQDFKYSLMAPDDLREYAGLTTTVVTCRQRIPMYAAGLDLIRWSLEGMFGALVNMEDDFEDETAVKKEEPQDDDDDYDPEKELNDSVDGDEAMYGEKSGFTGKTFRIMDSVTVRCHATYVEMEWEGNILNDGIADAVMAILTNLESSPAAVKCKLSFPFPPWNNELTQVVSSKQHSHDHGNHMSVVKAASPHSHVTPEQRLDRLMMFLEAQFGDCVQPLEPPKLGDIDMVDNNDQVIASERRFSPGVKITIDNLTANVYFDTLEIECRHESLKMRVKAVVERAVETIAPFVDLVGVY